MSDSPSVGKKRSFDCLSYDDEVPPKKMRKLVSLLGCEKLEDQGEIIKKILEDCTYCSPSNEILQTRCICKDVQEENEGEEIVWDQFISQAFHLLVNKFAIPFLELLEGGITAKNAHKYFQDDLHSDKKCDCENFRDSVDSLLPKKGEESNDEYSDSIMELCSHTVDITVGTEILCETYIPADCCIYLNYLLSSNDPTNGGGLLTLLELTKKIIVEYRNEMTDKEANTYQSEFEQIVVVQNSIREYLQSYGGHLFAYNDVHIVTKVYFTEDFSGELAEISQSFKNCNLPLVFKTAGYCYKNENHERALYMANLFRRAILCINNIKANIYAIEQLL